MGLYPLLQNNTSWFIAADFDELNWVDECRSFLKICEEHSLSAYLERSRSGKGGHVWIFFEEPYEAFRSRKIVLTLLEKFRKIEIMKVKYSDPIHDRRKLRMAKRKHGFHTRYSDESTPVFRDKVPHLFRSKVRQPDGPVISLSMRDNIQT